MFSAYCVERPPRFGFPIASFQRARSQPRNAELPRGILLTVLSISERTVSQQFFDDPGRSA